jgi:DNA-binding response OmpR family regulator
MQMKSINVLVVDDVLLMCDFLNRVVSSMPYCRAFKALDGKSAAEILENENIDLLITDIEIKPPNGLELVYRVRSGKFSATAHDIPIIVFSGNTYLEFIKQSISYDVNDFMAKPVSSEQLIRKVQYHLQNDKSINNAEYYAALAQKPANSIPLSDTNRKVSVAIVRDLKQKSDDELQNDGVVDSNRNETDFLVWPPDATTGYFQIDRRLKSFAFKITCFHNVVVNNCKPVAIESERKRACEAADYLYHIAKNIKHKDRRRDFWLLFQQRLNNLQPLITELHSLNVKHHSQVLLLLKRLSYWWMQTCNRPLIQRQDDSEGGSDA